MDRVTQARDALLALILDGDQITYMAPSILKMPTDDTTVWTLGVTTKVGMSLTFVMEGININSLAVAVDPHNRVLIAGRDDVSVVSQISNAELALLEATLLTELAQILPA